MIVTLSSTGAPELTDVDRLDRLHAVCSGGVGEIQYDSLCRPGPDAEHVWLSIAELRRAGCERSADTAFGTKFDGMIPYAGSKGWLSDDSTCVRAHVESA